MRRVLSYTLGALGFLGLAACGQSASPDGNADPPGAANVISETTASDDGLAYGARARDLPLGAHGVHIHSFGACEDVGVYTASGGHVGKDDGPHGLLHPDGAHRGDLPNMDVTASGTTRAEFFSALISVAELRDADCTALIIHTTRDDHQTQPIGRSGARIACARFRPKT